MGRKCRRRAYLEVLVDGRPRHVNGPCMPGDAAGEWAWGGGEFFAGTVERFLAWSAGTYVNVKAVENGRVYARRPEP